MPTIHPELDDEIAKLEGTEDRSAADTARLTEAKLELEKINKKKAEYVAEHPEQRKLIYRPRRLEGEDPVAAGKPVELRRNLFKKNGLPRRPERSIYYDSVMNPFGVAPPGMPYVERGEELDTSSFILAEHTCSAFT